ncbi:MAG TPA: DUF1351 domain-containing protein [Bacilli bacterium]|nr:DUF1351 domain-containing protein [Bacilli bacterium]
MLEKISNFVQLKNETIERLKPYVLLKVDKETYPDVVKKRAELNKELGKVDKERKDLNKFVNASYQEITDLYKEALEIVDSKLEAVENERRDEVLQEIMNAYASEKLPLSFEKVFDEKWLNKSVDWKSELRFKVNRIRDELAVAKKLDREAQYIESGNLADILKEEVESEEVCYTTFKLKNPTDDQISKVHALLTVLGVEYETHSE